MTRLSNPEQGDSDLVPPMTVKDYEDRYDVAHEAWKRDPNPKAAEALDRAKAALWRARHWPQGG